MDKDDMVHVCSAVKQNEVLPFATTQIDLEGVMPSEMSQTEKYKHRDFA